MTSDERITKAVFSAVDELNAQLPAGVAVEKSLDAPLYGAGGKLESLDFVTLIMEVEEKINAEIRHEHNYRRRKSAVQTKESLFHARNFDRVSRRNSKARP